jgi:alpha-glucosidase
MVCSLRGSVCVYQGEELGLTEAEVPFEALQDPYGIAFWPNFKGRDGCRTPMPWTADGANAGFSRGTPWLPVPPEHRALAVDAQEADPRSALHGFRAFLRWRHTQPALREGAIRFLDTAEPVLAFVRSVAGQELLVAFNLSGEPVELELPLEAPPAALDGHGLLQGALDGRRLRLPGSGSLFARLG